MAYLDMLLPIGVDLEWQTGGGFFTRVVRTDSGRESRIQEWDGSLAQGVLRYNARKAAIWEEIDEFFHIAEGRAHSWRLRDPRRNVATTAQGKFNGDQMVFRYTRGAYTFDKDITKPDPSVVLTGGGTFDPDSGRVLTGAPTAWSGPFYLNCRFDTDQLEVIGIDKQPGSGDLIAGFRDVPIVEVLDESAES